MLRTMGALGLVLGMLATALWVVRRYDLKLPGRVTGGARKRVELVERLAVDAKRSVALIRRDGCEHLIFIGPEGHATIETGITPPSPPVVEIAPEAEPSAKIEADLATLKAGVAKLAGKLDFKAMVDRVRLDAAAAEEPVAEAPVEPVVAAAAEPAVLPLAANDAEPAADEPEIHDVAAERAPRSRARKSQAAPTRTRIPRDTTRWNKRAVREALNA